MSEFCEVCDRPLRIVPSMGKNQDKVRFCSKTCRQTAARQQQRDMAGTSSWAKISPGKTGAVAELLVSADLLTRGYEVFRAVAQDGSCDLIILRHGLMLRVEIRSGYKTSDGTIKTSRNLDASKYDVLAIVYAGKEIVYTPDV